MILLVQLGVTSAVLTALLGTVVGIVEEPIAYSHPRLLCGLVVLLVALLSTTVLCFTALVLCWTWNW